MHQFDLLSRRVISCFVAAYNELGFGLSEKIYSTALEILFKEADIPARREYAIEVSFRGQKLGTYRLDYLTGDALVLELKAGHQLPPGSRAQLLSYLRTARHRTGLLLFFGPEPEVLRVDL